MNKLKSSKKNIKALDSSLEKLARLVNRNKNFITDIYKSSLYNDEPKIFAYSGIYKSKYRHNADVACGYSFNKKVALTRVLGEGLERYCLDHFTRKAFYAGQSKNIGLALNLLDMSYFSKGQLRDKMFEQFRVNENSKFRWIKAVSLMKGKTVLVPASLFVFNYKTIKNEPTIILPVSTGSATGLSIEDAIYRGICEIVERDAFMINYLNKIPSPRVDLISIKDKDIYNIINIFRRYKMEPIVFDLTTDLQIPAFAAIALDRTGLGPAVSVGLKAGFNIKEAILGAIEESLMTRSWIRDKFIYNDPNYKKGKEIITIEDRAHFWFPMEAIKHLDFWINSGNIKKINIKGIPTDKLREALKLLKDKNMQVLYVDITDKNIKRHGFVVVKVVIPQLHPLYLNEKYPYLGGGRLYNTPVSMGILQSPKKESELNKIPHPFL